jgi:hypothetical protein
MARTPDERKEADRQRHRKTYEKKKEEISAKNLARYYKRKEADPNYHQKPKGRPAKVSPAVPAEAPPPEKAPVQSFSPEKA